MLSLNTPIDQAEGLRRMGRGPAPRPPVQVIAVASGKGGVGKTNVSANLAISLAKLERQVLLMDADLGLANIDVLLNLQPRYNISHVIDGTRTLNDIVVPGPGGVLVMPAASGIQHLAQMESTECHGIVSAFCDFHYPIDTLVIDTAAGISDSMVTFTRAAREVLIVVCDEPTSITDAYATVKVLSSEPGGPRRYSVVANKVRSLHHGREIYNKLKRVSDRFLDVELRFLGTVPYDESLPRAERQQRAVVEAFPRSRSAMAFKKLAAKINELSRPNTLRGDLEFFVERLIQYRPNSEMSVV